MKKTFLCLLLGLGLGCNATVLHSQGVKKGKVLMVVREGKFLGEVELMLNDEVGVMTGLLSKAGFELKIGSPSGQLIVAGTKTLRPDARLSEVKMAEYEGFLIPCVSLMDGFPDTFVPMIKDAIAKGKPVAAQTGGVFALAKAGVLSGKKYAGVKVPNKKNYPEVQDAIYAGDGIVQDGRLITSAVCPMTAKSTGLPDGTTRLMEAFIAELRKNSR